MIVLPRVHLFLHGPMTPAQRTRARVLRDLDGVASIHCVFCGRRDCAHQQVAEMEKGTVLS